MGTSVVFNLTQYIPVTAAGIIFFFKEGLTLQDIRQKSNQTGDSVGIVSEKC